MRRKKSSLLIIILVLAIIFALMHVFATRFYLYWSYWWADNLLHFTGGLILAMLMMWLVYYSRERSVTSKLRAFIVTYILVMIIAIAWEIFEYKLGITQSTEKYSLDVLHDLIADSLGAIVGWSFATMKKFRVYE